MFPEALSENHRATAINHVRKMGDPLAQEGYRGFLEVDVLIDLDTDEVYLGEINPRISGASSMTNGTAGERRRAAVLVPSAGIQELTR